MLKFIKMNKKYLLVIVFLFSFIFINNVNADEYCSGVNVCPNAVIDLDKYNFGMNCNITKSDGYCPENYSKSLWTAGCPIINVGWCYPCDVDCSKCPRLSLIVTRRINVNGNITAIGFQEHKKSLNIKVDRAEGAFGVDTNCGSSPTPVICEAVFNDTCSNPSNPPSECNPNAPTPGKIYCFIARSIGAEGGDLVTMCGAVRPLIRAYVNSAQANEGSIFNMFDKEDILINESIQSIVGVTRGRINVYKWSNKFSTFLPINLDQASPDYCSFRCPSNVCSSLVTVDTTSPYPINTPPPVIQGIMKGKRCENKEYFVNATGYDTNYQLAGDEANLGFKLIILNTNPVCTDECSIFTSKTLETVVAKIKTWLAS